MSVLQWKEDEKGSGSLCYNGQELKLGIYGYKVDPSEWDKIPVAELPDAKDHDEGIEIELLTEPDGTEVPVVAKKLDDDTAVVEFHEMSFKDEWWETEGMALCCILLRAQILSEASHAKNWILESEAEMDHSGGWEGPSYHLDYAIEVKAKSLREVFQFAEHFLSEVARISNA